MPPLIGILGFLILWEIFAMLPGMRLPGPTSLWTDERTRTLLLYPDVSAPSQKTELTEQFLASWNQGDMEGLVALMAEDVTFWADGGGKVVAARKPLCGSVKVARFLTAIRHSKLIPAFTSQIVQINGQPGIINFVDNRPQSIFSFEFGDGCVRSIFAVVNPDKLRSVQVQR